MKKFIYVLVFPLVLGLVSCGDSGDNDENKKPEEKVNLVLSKESVEIPYMTESVLTLGGTEISNCKVEIDDWFADAIVKNNNEIRIIARKAGKTKLKVSYKESFVECDIVITAFNNYCGDPYIEELGKTREEIVEKYGEPSSGSYNFSIGKHFYRFENGILYYILLHDNVVTLKNGKPMKPSDFAERAHNSLKERYEYMTTIGETEYFRYKNTCYIASTPGTGNNGDNWKIYYAKTLEEVKQLAKLK